MTIDELKVYLLVNSNQYFIGAENIEVDSNVLNGLVNKGLGLFGNHRPSVIYEQINIASENQKIRHTQDGRIITYINKMYITNPMIIDDPQQVGFNYKYIKDTGTLYTMGRGSYWCSIFTIPLLEDITIADTEFLNIMIGLYLQYVGSVRKGFTIDGLPIANDAEDLYSNGQELVNETLQELKETDSSWYMAIE